MKKGEILMKANYCLLYSENSDTYAPSTVRHFASKEEALIAMRKSYLQADEILHFPTGYEDDENYTYYGGDFIHVHMGMDAFSWEVRQVIVENEEATASDDSCEVEVPVVLSISLRDGESRQEAKLRLFHLLDSEMCNLADHLIRYRLPHAGHACDESNDVEDFKYPIDRQEIAAQLNEYQDKPGCVL